MKQPLNLEEKEKSQGDREGRIAWQKYESSVFSLKISYLSVNILLERKFLSLSVVELTFFVRHYFKEKILT